MSAYTYDILVVGAGPAGSAAALSASRKGARVLMVERRRVVGMPVQCAEYIPAMLKGQLDLGGSYVVQKVIGMRTFVRDQAAKETVAPGYIIRRDLFDQTLANAAVLAGAELRCDTRASAMDSSGEVMLVSNSGASFKVHPRVIIGADGPHSTVGTWVGAVNRHLLPGLQRTLELAAPLTHTEIYFEPEIIAGYGWLFPKGVVANVGVGMRPPSDGNRIIRQVLDRFVSRLVAEGKVFGPAVGHAAGWIPTQPMPRAVYGNVMLAGDAAGHTHPISGAGVFTAIACGTMAGKWAARAIAADDLGSLVNYDLQWRDLLGHTLSRAWEKRQKMEAEWENFDQIIRSCWIAYREYYA